MKELVTINGLKRVAERLYYDTKILEGNSMVKVDDLVDAFKDALEKEESF